MKGLSAQTRIQLATAVVLLALAALFAFQLRALATHRLDYPLIDDWRYYRLGKHALAFQLPDHFSLRWLFEPAQDTLHVSGKLLDWLLLRGVAHDYRVLAIASFVLAVGGWLVAAVGWCVAASREQPLLRLAALTAFVLPLAASPFFAALSPLQRLEPAIAYHQMLPMIGLSALGWMATRSRRIGGPHPLLTVPTTVFFSLAYSSGAVALFLFGSAVLAASWVRRKHEGGELLRFGFAVTLPAAVCLGLHIGLSAMSSGHNPVLETRGAYGVTLPNERDFWQFVFGLFDRAVLSTAIGALPTWRGAAVAVATAAPFLGLGVLLFRGRLDDRSARAVIPMVALMVAIYGYVALVAYGRADFGDWYLDTVDSPETRATLYAHNRFFYWWITAMLPLAALAWGLLLTRLSGPRVATVATWALVALALAPKSSYRADTSYLHSWRYDAVYRHDAKEVLEQMVRDRRQPQRQRSIGVAWQKGATFVLRFGLDRPPRELKDR